MWWFAPLPHTEQALRNMLRDVDRLNMIIVIAVSFLNDDCRFVTQPTLEEVSASISSHKASGPDNITAELLKMDGRASRITGFRRDRSTADQIFNLRLIPQKWREFRIRTFHWLQASLRQHEEQGAVFGDEGAGSRNKIVKVTKLSC